MFLVGMQGLDLHVGTQGLDLPRLNVVQRRLQEREATERRFQELGATERVTEREQPADEEVAEKTRDAIRALACHHADR